MADETVVDLSTVTSEDSLEQVLSEPYVEDVQAARDLRDGLIILGAGGKMGPTLVRRAVECMRRSGHQFPVFAVSRFGNSTLRAKLESWGARTIVTDLLDEDALARLPRVPNLIYMAGKKFGSSGDQPSTWAMNSYLPGRVAAHFKSARMVSFSTGNVYPFVTPESGGSLETDLPGPVGEYAQSCLGRERILQYLSRKEKIPMCILRLNYAAEARYGVLLDIAQKVYTGHPVNLRMGYLNAIWQGDANSVCLRSFALCETPPKILNLTGPELLSVRGLAQEFGKRFGREPFFEGTEASKALLSNASQCHQLLGPPKVPVEEVLNLVANWVVKGKTTLGKPTKFEVRDGRF